ncbi:MULTISPECIES: porin family protein [unclassified Polaribacter]|uniref:porin family protein n=1 Tax=unclassified Polaribacter TaxID=196858 RepID=UPI0011BF0366|nr:MULTISPECIES: porin family protein [unclassified Polaribacter]TXD52776.1 PorT family protein [Polaribacter sp. IC063]TXD61653.1 PorT family protein [Polaribacter sp. IC066]
MKTIYITIALMITSIISLSAQDRKNKSTAGIKGGYNVSSVSFDGSSETEKLHGYHIGIYGESYIGKYLSIQPEILYSKQGYKIIDENGTYTQKLDYINVPLMLKVYPVKSFFIEAGPQIGFSIAHKETFDSGFILYDTSKEFEPSNFDWGVNLGVGFKSDAGVTLAARYHLGQSDIYDEDKPKNRVLQISLGFEF